MGETIERRMRAAAPKEISIIELYKPAGQNKGGGPRPISLGPEPSIRGEQQNRTRPSCSSSEPGDVGTRVVMTTLAEADSALANMRTPRIVGAAATRSVSRNGRVPGLHTARRAGEPAMRREALFEQMRGSSALARAGP